MQPSAAPKQSPPHEHIQKLNEELLDVIWKTPRNILPVSAPRRRAPTFAERRRLAQTSEKFNALLQARRATQPVDPPRKQVRFIEHIMDEDMPLDLKDGEVLMPTPLSGRFARLAMELEEQEARMADAHRAEAHITMEQEEQDQKPQAVTQRIGWSTPIMPLSAGAREVPTYPVPGELPNEAGFAAENEDEAEVQYVVAQLVEMYWLYYRERCEIEDLRPTVVLGLVFMLGAWALFRLLCWVCSHLFWMLVRM